MKEVTGLYPATVLKEKTPIRVFSDEFCKNLRPLFYNSRRLFLSYKKTFYHQNSKEPYGKRQKMETACKKNNDTCWKKLKNYLNQVFISFYYLKISLLLYSVVLCYRWYIESASFYKQFNPAEDLSTTKNYFSPSVISTQIINA